MDTYGMTRNIDLRTGMEGLMTIVKDGQGNAHDVRGCHGYKECAYWAFKKYASKDGEETKHFCGNCYTGLYRHGGWTPCGGDEHHQTETEDV